VTNIRILPPPKRGPSNKERAEDTVPYKDVVLTRDIIVLRKGLMLSAGPQHRRRCVVHQKLHRTECSRGSRYRLATTSRIIKHRVPRSDSRATTFAIADGMCWDRLLSDLAGIGGTVDSPAGREARVDCLCACSAALSRLTTHAVPRPLSIRSLLLTLL
jgi:hypothetical protein